MRDSEHYPARCTKESISLPPRHHVIRSFKYNKIPIILTRDSVKARANAPYPSLFKREGGRSGGGGKRNERSGTRGGGAVWGARAEWGGSADALSIVEHHMARGVRVEGVRGAIVCITGVASGGGGGERG